MENRHMSADGTWKLSMKTPIGERKSTLALASGRRRPDRQADQRRGRLHRHLRRQGQPATAVSFKAAIKNPMPLTLEFSGSVDGDKISGTVSASGVGSWPFSGARG